MIASAFTGLEILVIENDPSMRKFLRVMLLASTKEIAEYAEASNGEESLQLLGAYSPDVIISSWSSEPVSGIDLLRHVRNDASGNSKFTPFIMLTSRDDSRWRTEARDAGVSKYLVKPVLVQDLFQAITDVTREVRPFVRAEGFFGPDRRHRDNLLSGPERRVREPELIPPTDGEPLTQPAFA